MPELVQLGDYVEIVTGNPFKSSDYVDSGNGIRLLRGDNIAQGKIRWEDAKYWPTGDAQTYAHYLLRAGDVILAMDRPWIEAGLKYAELRDGDIPSLLVQRVARLRATSALDQRFLSYLVGSPGFAAYILGVQTGTAVPHISSKQIQEFEFPLLNLRHQQAIGEVLGALDDKIVANEDILNVSRRLLRLKYAQAVHSGVKPTTIGAIADIFDGPHATPRKTESGPWFLSISSLRNGRLVLEESAHLAEHDFKLWTRRVIPVAGDVLFSYETRLGEAALMPVGVRACLGRRMALMRPRSVGSRTLLQAFLSPSFQETIRQYSVHGATVDRISLSEFPSWQIDLPSHDARKLEHVLSDLDELAEQRERENESLAEIRYTLLPKLMSGEICVRDAEKVVEEVT
jgi:type I restriction enzyme S subunit